MCSLPVERITDVNTHRFGLIREKRVINSIHGSEVGHVGQEDGDFDRVFQR